MKSPFSAPGRSGASLSSNVKPPNAGEPVTKSWKSIAGLASAVASQGDGLQAQADKVSALKFISRKLIELHPFKIYQIPAILRSTGGTPATDWLKFRVRAGRVLETDATGTDGINDDPDSENVAISGGEISVPAGTSRFWFWLEIGADDETTTAIVRYGPDPTAESYGPWTTENPWDLAPKPDGGHVPIGWVDTLTNQSNYTPVIRQLLRTDLVFLGSECP